MAYGAYKVRSSRWQRRVKSFPTWMCPGREIEKEKLHSEIYSILEQSDCFDWPKEKEKFNWRQDLISGSKNKKMDGAKA